MVRGAVRRQLGRAPMLVAMVVIYLPIVVVVLLSFNVSKYGTFPFEFTTRWYSVLFGDSRLLSSALTSLVLAAAVAAAACVVGTAAALWMVRYSRRAMVPLTGLMAAAITVPWLILSIAILLVANAAGIGRGYPALFVGSLVVVIPYVAFLVIARLQGTGTRLEEAAASLGARPWTAFRLITLPQIARAAGSGTLFAFIITFNNFPVQYFLAPFGLRTLPLEIYTMVRSGYEPSINALATILIGAAVVAAVVVARPSHGAGRGGIGATAAINPLTG